MYPIGPEMTFMAENRDHELHSVLYLESDIFHIGEKVYTYSFLINVRCRIYQLFSASKAKVINFFFFALLMW